MIELLWCIAAFSTVWLLRRMFAGYLLAASQLLSGSSRLGKAVYFLLFFPGIIIHELAHFFAASLVGVKTGEVEILPREIQGGVKYGSVQVEKTDSFRSAIIGSAPLLVGLGSLWGIVRYRFSETLGGNLGAAIVQLFSRSFGWEDLLFFYLLFSISNTMVLSKSDRKGLLPATAITGIVSVAIFTLAGEAQRGRMTAFFPGVFVAFAATLTPVILANIGFLLPLVSFVKLLEKAKGKRVRMKLF